jgi:voltage-gated potassium channel
VFVLDLVVKFPLAPRKVEFLQGNWITLLALLLPALRVDRLARLLRVGRAACGCSACSRRSTGDYAP